MDRPAPSVGSSPFERLTTELEGQMTWFGSMFSGEEESGDVVGGRALNITKITALLVPIGTAIAALIEAQTGEEGPLGGLTPGQKLTLWLGVLLFILVVVAVDMLVRGIATAASFRSGVSLLPGGFKATYTEPEPDVPCTLVATRAFSGDVSSKDGEFLIIVEDDATQVARWVKGRYIALPAGN